MKKIFLYTLIVIAVIFGILYLDKLDNGKRLRNETKDVNLAQRNLQFAEEFLSTNRERAGVVALENGMQYKIIHQGTGLQPTANDVVTVNYEGKLLNGTVFDSSYKRGKPVSFPVYGVIPGWQIALQKMHVGAIWEIFIPSNLAYGKKGVVPVIGPDELLIFKVQLLGVKNKMS